VCSSFVFALGLSKIKEAADFLWMKHFSIVATRECAVRAVIFWETTYRS
jgi:hypothetical protein